MEIQLLTQPTLSNGEAFSLGEAITSILTSKKPKYKTANFIFGVIKPNAIEYLKPYFIDFLENKGTINFYIDKRASYNNLLSELLNIGCNIFIFNSEDGITEFQYRGCFFESLKKADVFLSSGNLSINGLFDSFNIITHLTYNIGTEEKSEFVKLKEDLLNSSLLNNFQKFTLDTLENSSTENTWNYSKSTNTPIPSISDFTKKTVPENQEIDDRLSDSNIVIEIDDSVDFLVPVETPKEIKKVENKETATPPENTPKIINTEPILDYPAETIYYNTDCALDVEMLLFENKSHKPISKKTSTKRENIENLPHDEVITNETSIPEESQKSKIIVKSGDLSKTAIFMFEAPKITKRGICAGEIKVPVYLRDSIANFWEWPGKYSIVGGHSKIKSRICTFDIIDTSTPNQHIKDTNVKLFQREDESSFSIHSKELEALNITENDIIRLIKTQDGTDTYYTCEIVRHDAKEYAIWEQFCTHEMKNSKRKYGIM